jgi:hypothetical protein
MLYVLAADAVLMLHVLFVAFVIVGLVLIVVGRLMSWSWVRNWWFRVIHLVAIGIVVLQSWLGVICPLTRLCGQLCVALAGSNLVLSCSSLGFRGKLYGLRGRGRGKLGLGTAAQETPV